MKQLPRIWDERTGAWCVYCGGAPTTRDHVPSKILLDEPYPENLPVVPCCRKCNTAFSVDEEYLACLIGCVLAGSAEPTLVARPKVQRLLRERPRLAARIAKARVETVQATLFNVEERRVRRALLKLARGHVHYELNEARVSEPSEFNYAPLPTLESEARKRFERLLGSGELAAWPEVGSRAMQRLLEGHDLEGGWVVVQPGRYRYATMADSRIGVRIVLSEYLACEAIWP
jgi:hypothetical protein